MKYLGSLNESDLILGFLLALFDCSDMTRCLNSFLGAICSLQIQYWVLNQALPIQLKEPTYKLNLESQIKIG
jgi:hypothetical protein